MSVTIEEQLASFAVQLDHEVSEHVTGSRRPSSEPVLAEADEPSRPMRRVLAAVTVVGVLVAGGAAIATARHDHTSPPASQRNANGEQRRDLCQSGPIPFDQLDADALPALSAVNTDRSKAEEALSANASTLRARFSHVVDLTVGLGYGRAWTRDGSGKVVVESVDDYAVIVHVESTADCPTGGTVPVVDTLQGNVPVLMETRPTAARAGLPQMAGMTIISDAEGNAVGYAPTARVLPSGPAEVMAINAQTLTPVTNAEGTLVGYTAQTIGYIPLTMAQQPGFDVEALRAKTQGGCESQIGDPTFKQEFPLCPWSK